MIRLIRINAENRFAAQTACRSNDIYGDIDRLRTSRLRLLGLVIKALSARPQENFDKDPHGPSCGPFLPDGP